MILTGPAIRAAYERGDIQIDPYDKDLVNPTSYDLRLGETVRRYAEPNWMPLDSAKKNDSELLKIEPKGFIVLPGYLYLMHTVERIHTKRYVSVLDGKSSIARLGLVVHLTAGYGDPGFDGQYTLEVTSIAHPVRIYAGMRFAQIRFHETVGSLEDYQISGHYTQETARGPVASQSFRQFKK